MAETDGRSADVVVAVRLVGVGMSADAGMLEEVEQSPSRSKQWWFLIV